MRLTGVSLRNLASRPLRTALTILGIAVAVASFVALVGTVRGFENAWRVSVAERGSHMIAVRKGAVELLAASLDESVGEDLRRVEGVEAVAAQLISLLAVEPQQVVLAKGWGRTEYLWKSVRFSAGAPPGPDQPRGVILGEVVADGLRKSVGDTIRLQDRDFTVTGIGSYGGAVNRSTLLLPLPTLQEVLDRPGKVTLFDLRLREPDDPARVAALKERLARDFPALRFHETNEVTENNQLLRLLRAVVWGISVIALFMGALVVLITLVMSVSERTYDIGVLSAIGWQAARILSMVLAEGIVLAVVGSVLGAVLGVGAMRLLAHLPPARGFLEPAVTVRLILDVLGAALVIGIVGSVYPAWRAVRLNPVDALRHE
jgi:putative ABC transport system permease protein